MQQLHKSQTHHPEKPCPRCGNPWIVDDDKVCIDCYRRGVRTIKPNDPDPFYHVVPEE